MNENELNNLLKDELKTMRLTLISYLKECEDLFKIIEELSNNTKKFYDNKISYVTKLLDKKINE